MNGLLGVFRRAFATALLCTATLSSHAAAQWCTGTLDNLIVYSNGDLVARFNWRGDYVRVCNMNGTMGQITPVTCAGWLSLAKSAIQRGVSTIVYYPEGPSCAAMPTYSNAPEPAYFMLQN